MRRIFLGILLMVFLTPFGWADTGYVDPDGDGATLEWTPSHPYTVTEATTDPLHNGQYYESGSRDGYPSYTNEDRWLVFCAGCGNYWTLMNTQDQPPPCNYYLSSGSTDPIGTYDPCVGQPDHPVVAATEHYTLIDDGTRQPNTPDTSNYINVDSYSGTFIDIFTMEDLADVGSVSAIKIWVYEEQLQGGENGTVTLYVDISKDGSTWEGEQVLVNHGQSAAWFSSDEYYTGLNWSQSDINGLQVKLKGVLEGDVVSASITVYAMYAEITYTPLPSTILKGVTLKGVTIK